MTTPVDPIAGAKDLLLHAGYIVLRASDHKPSVERRVAEAWRVSPRRLAEALEVVHAAGYRCVAGVSGNG